LPEKRSNGASPAARLRADERDPSLPRELTLALERRRELSLPRELTLARDERSLPRELLCLSAVLFCVPPPGGLGCPTRGVRGLTTGRNEPMPPWAGTNPPVSQSRFSAVMAPPSRRGAGPPCCGGTGGIGGCAAATPPIGEGENVMFARRGVVAASGAAMGAAHEPPSLRRT